MFSQRFKKNYKEFNENVKPNAINIDQDIDPSWAKKNLNNICIQGGMNPEILLKDEKAALLETEKYLDIFKNNHTYLTWVMVSCPQQIQY